MFGHQDDQPQQQDTGAGPDQPATETTAEDKPSGQPTETAASTNPASTATDTTSDTPANADEDKPKPAPGAAPAPAADPSAKPPTQAKPWQHPGSPLNDDEAKVNDIISPAGGFPKRPSYQDQPGSADSTAPTPSLSPLANLPGVTDSATHELIDIKQQALSELSPLIDKLDQPPEEKFRTIMMMIQASDDQSMLKAAHTAAHGIEDEKTRAQALLDIINEVNYFTQQPEV